MKPEARKWIGVDLDGTLARWDGFQDITEIGQPLLPMVHRVQRWLQEGRDVRIFTARLDWPSPHLVREAVHAWCRKHIGRELPITNIKDHLMGELWDDRAVGVQFNTGEIRCGLPDEGDLR